MTVKLIVLKGEYYFGKHVSPLIVDRKDPKWLLLEQVLNITTLRRTKQELAKHRKIPLTMAGNVIRTIFILMFFCVDYAYVVGEL